MSYDRNTDYSVLLKRAMAAGADQETVQLLLDRRVEKALANPSLVRYANDEVYREALQYLADAESSRQDGYQAALDQARQAAVAAREAQTRQQIDALSGQEGEIRRQAAGDRSQAVAAARLSALAGEERLAALGLGAGLGAPSSGYQETSRIARDVALQNNLAGVDASETSALRQLAAEIRQARQTGLADVAELEEKYQLMYAQYEQQKQESQARQEQQLYDRQQDALKNYLQQAQWQAQQDQTRYQHQQDAYEQALARWQLTGVVSEADAAVLGVPAGTKTASYQAQLFQQAKSAGTRSSGGGSRKSASKGASVVSTAKAVLQTGGASAAYAYLVSQGYSGSRLISALSSLGLSKAVIQSLRGEKTKTSAVKTKAAAQSKTQAAPRVK